jgi:glycine cleavage system aminomethyltransferase T
VNLSLAFLTASGPAIAESPLAHLTGREGAVLGVRDGWLVPERFAAAEVEAVACRETVAWADASSLGKFEIAGDVSLAGAWCLRVTPSRTLVLTEPDRSAAALTELGPQAIDVTAQYGALRIAGPLARETIARFCALDLRPAVTSPGRLLPGSVARTPGYVLCEGEDRYLLLFGAAVSEYMWIVVSDAGRHLGGCPVGVRALARGTAHA